MNMNLVGNWSYPTNIKFGAGRITEIGESCQQLGMQNPLLVTDRGLADLAITQQTRALIEASGIQHNLFSDVDANPTDKNLEAGVEVYKQGNHDGVIAFGGGSGLDLGKMIAFMAGQTRPVWDFEDIGDWWQRADNNAIAPIIAVPTTAGTGSEVGRASVIADTENHVKKIIFHPKVLPSIVISDPELTIGLPAHITAGTGLDAFAHCLEAYCSPHFHPMSQGIAIEGLRLVKEYLPRAYADGTDIEARANLMAAATMGATAFQKGLGAIHAISHPVGAVYNAHHGTTNAVCMPAVLKFNRSAIEDKIQNLANFLGIAGGFDGFYGYVVTLNQSMSIPTGLRDLGVEEHRIPELAEMAAKDPSCGGNPIELTVENLTQLIKGCY
jgi:alcohol dehydrogenase class IV